MIFMQRVLVVQDILRVTRQISVICLMEFPVVTNQPILLPWIQVIMDLH